MNFEESNDNNGQHTRRGTIMFHWEQLIIEANQIEDSSFFFLVLTTSGVAFFCLPWSPTRMKNKLFVSTIYLSRIFFAILVSNNRRLQVSLLFLQLSPTELGSTLESTAELNYLRRPILVLGSPYVKFDVWTEHYFRTRTRGNYSETCIKRTPSIKWTPAEVPKFSPTFTVK